MQSTTQISPPQPRRPRRLGIEAHTQFVATLVSELQSSLTRLQAGTGRLSGFRAGSEGSRDVDVAAAVDVGRETSDLLRLVRLLNVIDGPGTDRHLVGLNLPSVAVEVAMGLDIAVTVNGEWGQDLIAADAESVRTGFEFLFLALAEQGKTVEIHVVNDRLVVIDGTVELTDPRANWRLRCARRVLEGEGCRVRFTKIGERSRLELRAYD